MSFQRITLRRIADARSGDKGSSGNIGIIPHSPEAFAFLQTTLTAEKVEEYFKPLGVESVVRYELPNLQCFNFVLKGVLGLGGSRSLRLDPQGKALGQSLLDIPLDVPVSLCGFHDDGLVNISYPSDLVCVLSLNRPAKRNALNIGMLKEMTAALEKIKEDSSARVVIIKGEGPVFCAGMDLTEAADSLKIEQSAEWIAQMLTALIDAPFVTIAIAQGIAAGGGAGILSACDIVIGSEELQILYPEVRRGLIPAQVAPLLTRLLPRHVVNELLLTGEPLMADRALLLGLVNKLAKDEFLLHEALNFADQILKGAPEAMKETKQLLRDLDVRTFIDDLTITLPYHHRSRHSAEAKEGYRAFCEKRSPRWGIAEEN